MRFSPFNRFAAVIIVFGGVVTLCGIAALAQTQPARQAQRQTPAIANVGRTPTAEEMAAVDRTVGTTGKELPPGRGTAKEGAAIYARKCAYCHGQNMEGVRQMAGTGALIGGPRLAGAGPPTWAAPASGIKFFAFVTTVYDYIYRAMPPYQPYSLQPDEAYALTAYILFKNDLIKEDTVMDRETLPKVEMPNRHSFIPDKLEDIPDIEKRGCYKTYGVCP